MPKGDGDHYRIADNHPPSPAHTSDSEDTATEKWHYHLITKFFYRWRRTAHSMALSRKIRAHKLLPTLVLRKDVIDAITRFL